MVYLSGQEWCEISHFGVAEGGDEIGHEPSGEVVSVETLDDTGSTAYISCSRRQFEGKGVEIGV